VGLVFGRIIAREEVWVWLGLVNRIGAADFKDFSISVSIIVKVAQLSGFWSNYFESGSII
jgi:hypothetical protein